ncbi:pentatricopeptide repeat-containing protein At3g42630 isoform X1 [Dioscorea cayenensis subsp. rotundata]|uniref:Pentatricopeptide repeat-containing protein At3g42630 isoform X1 n=1 Tax=Dioscorea cayennensis subsp. rotundata TaxID=55577 RepID=A0AB40AZ41_DIOCR|nr:pentatricopeptide repeat-containing protein At3g42630 isoform X1 [Dioscorea cayenensis subsp. rotundata]
METLAQTLVSFPHSRPPWLHSCRSRVCPWLCASVPKWMRAERQIDDVEFAKYIHVLCRERKPDSALQLVSDMKHEGLMPGCDSLSALLLCCAQNNCFAQAQALWDEIINSSLVPSFETVSGLIDAYARMERFEEINRVLRETASRGFSFCPDIYSLAISCFGKSGRVGMMEATIKEMVSRGFKVDSAAGNAFVKYYSMFGSLAEMETAYGQLKRSRILIEEEAIRAVSSAYIRERKFYRLGEFLRDVGLRRRNAGNLLWNLLLLSYAANFKMKSLQREFIRMVDAGFQPDLTTFNIRALAFSKMSMFWDLHISIEHMKHEKVTPDLVTFGCIVDAYLDRRLGRNLSFALNKMDVESFPLISTDFMVFEVMGKGDFHSSSEALLESMRIREWTYSKLIAIYLKKKYRSNQIFWNY